MSKVKKFWEIAKADGAISGYICLLTSVGLLIASFCVPPVGEINSSVLRGVSELFAFATLFQLKGIIASIKDGHSLKLSAGGVDVTVSTDENKQEKEGE